jgi:hypothetical protein
MQQSVIELVVWINQITVSMNNNNNNDDDTDDRMMFKVNKYLINFLSYSK